VNPGAHPRDPRGLGASAGGAGGGGSSSGGGGRTGLSRRSFLTRTAGASLAAGGLGPLVAGCGSGAVAAPQFTPLPQPHKPVKWPILAANKAIAGGKTPEAHATLKVYTWVDHVSQRCLDDFSQRYRCQVELTTFTTITQALATLKRGRGRFDVFLGAPADVIGGLVGRGIIQPLNHSYVPNMRHAWPVFADPYYDSHWLYTVPYTVYTTGIAWRKDLVDVDPYSLVNGWGFPWVAKRSGKTAILDDYRESIALALLYNGVTDVSTTDPLIIDTARQSLLNLNKTVGLHIGNDTSQQLATGRSWIHHAWSGQVVAAARRLPPGVPVEALGYWFPPDGKGPVANDTGTVLRGAQNPVLAHLLLNFLLNKTNAMHNIAATGYIQPLTYVTPQRLVSEGILPASLTSAIVLATYLDHGYKEVELQPAADRLWQQAWRTVVRAHH
jgi:spermidine/putrescine transport system substrate-binding protein